MKSSIHEALGRYVRFRIPTGSFLHAVLSNDLMEAMAKADEDNKDDIHEICRYIHNNLPMLCYGSSKKVRKWLAGRDKV